MLFKFIHNIVEESISVIKVVCFRGRKAILMMSTFSNTLHLHNFVIHKIANREFTGRMPFFQILLKTRKNETAMELIDEIDPFLCGDRELNWVLCMV